MPVLVLLLLLLRVLLALPLTQPHPLLPAFASADERVWEGDVAAAFLEAFSRHISNPYRLFQ